MFAGFSFEGSDEAAAALARNPRVERVDPDLASNLIASEGRNCVAAGPPADDHGHGTHVAGTAAAAYNGGEGVVGVATDASRSWRPRPLERPGRLEHQERHQHGRPHVAGVAALVLGANPTLTAAEVRARLISTGECPDGTVASAGNCTGHGHWEVGSLFGNEPDLDGIPEPLVNALRAAQAAGMPGPDTTPPTVAVTAPADGSRVRGTVTSRPPPATTGA